MNYIKIKKTKLNEVKFQLIKESQEILKLKSLLYVIKLKLVNLGIDEEIKLILVNLLCKLKIEDLLKTEKLIKRYSSRT